MGKKLYVKMLLKNIQNDSDNFETVTNELKLLNYKIFGNCVFLPCSLLRQIIVKESRKSLTTLGERRRLSP